MKRIKFIANVAIGGKQKGQEFTLTCDENGIPRDFYWRRRFQDSAVDNCISVVRESSQKEEKIIKKDSKGGEK